MKQAIKSLVVLAAASVIGTSAIAQQSSTATAGVSATIITPISISKTADMNFGNIAVSTGSGGTVILAPGGSRTPSGGVSLPATTGSPSAASFTVTGEGSYTYAITLPSSAVSIDDNASHTMDVTAFTSTPTPTGTLSSGTQTLNVGATLTVGAAQAVGTYSADVPFDVTVNYN